MNIQQKKALQNVILEVAEKFHKRYAPIEDSDDLIKRIIVSREKYFYGNLTPEDFRDKYTFLTNFINDHLKAYPENRDILDKDLIRYYATMKEEINSDELDNETKTLAQDMLLFWPKDLDDVLSFGLNIDNKVNN